MSSSNLMHISSNINKATVQGKGYFITFEIAGKKKFKEKNVQINIFRNSIQRTVN